MFNKRASADLALILCALIWGATFVVVQNALVDTSVLVFIALRFSIAALLMRVIFWRALRGLGLSTLWAGMQIGFFLLGGFVLQTAGLKFTTPSKAAFITGLSVVLVPVLLAVFGNRKIGMWIWAGAFSSFVGLYFLAVPPSGIAALNRGDLLIFGCAIMFALQFIFVGRYARLYPVGALSFLQVATTAVGAAVLMPLFSSVGWERPRVLWTPRLSTALIITSIGATVICFSLQTWAQRHTSPARTAILLSLEPVFAALISWRLAAEHFGARTIIGAALILTGILFAEWKGQEGPGAEATGGI